MKHFSVELVLCSFLLINVIAVIVDSRPGTTISLVDSTNIVRDYPTVNTVSRPKWESPRYSNPWESSGDSKQSSSAFGVIMRGLTIMWKKMTGNDPFSTTLPTEEELNAELPIETPAFVGRNDEEAPTDQIEFTWIGHATTLVSLDGVNVITDPIFSYHCAPISTDSLKRYRRPACSVDQLPAGPLIVLISHNHYDHLDYNSMVQIHERFGNNVTFMVPEGLAAWFRDNIDNLRYNGVIEMTWWQSVSFIVSNKDGEALDNELKVISTPNQHWSIRTPFNRNKSLWSSWVVIWPSGKRFFFAGDTGYCPAFKEIGDELGPFDVAAIPIGAYKPREVMIHHHVDPNEAVKIHVDIKSKKSIGIHWGTFRLSKEPVFAPKADLAAALTDQGVDESSFITTKIGETISISN